MATTKTKKVTLNLKTMLADLNPQMQKTLREATYMGCCIMQAPGAWTRIGHTWHHDRHGWFVWGHGIVRWGTKRGLAELVGGAGTTPELHALGLSCAPTPNMLFAVHGEALENPHLAPVKELMAGGNPAGEDA
jgi:hypothetical protein